MFSVLGLALWAYFIEFEVMQFLMNKNDLMGYFFDIWNIVDLSTLGFYLTYMVMLNACIIMDDTIFTIHNVRTVGSITCFLLWIKMFYWMRLFSTTAYFVKLIIATVSDIRMFFYMIMIIICAFANFFYIINYNTVDGVSYVDEKLGIHSLDSFLYIYMLALGEFNTDNYSNGHNQVICWFMFVLASFFIVVVFMNMLIAIMGDTYATV